ncbi:hypothetical protein P3T76_007830 [Phytophthora citrophthora]|uniref:Uncharacterized protein n=1 Tax=Phytophthora citrophthora TaxID=4793 RepID=A0AAD9LNG1_9STRA|nr:hypothetical protein P3T76_007830 [Phytophthora citrophthora]
MTQSEVLIDAGATSSGLRPPATPHKQHYTSRDSRRQNPFRVVFKCISRVVFGASPAFAAQLGGLHDWRASAEALTPLLNR